MVEQVQDNTTILPWMGNNAMANERDLCATETIMWLTRVIIKCGNTHESPVSCPWHCDDIAFLGVGVTPMALVAS